MSDIEVVRGEIQPWTDYSSYRRPAGGEALLALLSDALPQNSGRTLIAGPHSTEVIRLAVARSRHVTVLIRSVSDAGDLNTAFPGSEVTVIAGALDGLADGPYDVVIAADGLDRVLGYDSPALDWPQRAGLLQALAGPEALVLIAVENEFALPAQFDRRPVDSRHGDDEWRPLHDDPARPTSPDQVRAALPVTRLYALFDAAGTSHTLLDTTAAAEARPGRLGARLAHDGLAASAAHTPLVASITAAADAAARAGLLGAVAPGWLAICGPAGTTHTAYTAAQRLDRDDNGWTVDGRHIPDTVAAETELFRLAAAEDVPGFRAYAARIQAFPLDDLYPAGDGFVPGVTQVPAGAGREELLAAAWFRFRDRLVAAHRRHPWPPWMVDSDDLVTTWLAMSGVEANPELLARGRELAALLAGPVVDEPDLASVLAEAEEDRKRAKELAGRIFGLERTLRFRDQSLKTREQAIRNLRKEVRGFRASPVLKLHEVARKAAKIKDPKGFARAVKRRIGR
ncbi:hypothetical protein [Actinoplanes solisilvae]|uniref:hypothetical protein n=1 Tax=Actinoplanes solisilvae TaxID=2486853 RepID=UPI000FDBEBAF|nr:hypothetical protein [Actinoplanes solisilvae]